MPKVLLVSEMIPDSPCGVVTYYNNLLHYFRDDPEVDLTLATIKDTSTLEKRFSGLVRKLINAFSFLNPKLAIWADDVYYAWMLRFALKRFAEQKIDLLHAQEPRTAYVAKRYFKGSIPVMLTCHFNDSPVEEEVSIYDVHKENVRNYLVDKNKKFFRQIDHLVFVSNYCYRQSEYLTAKISRTSVIHNGVVFETSGKKIEPGAKLSIINTGSIEHRKNQVAFVDLAKALLDRGYDRFHITLLGTGPDFELLKRKIQEQNLTEFFSLPGWVNNVQDYLDKANLYIHTSRNDNCPFSVIESVGRKTATLAFKVGGLPEILEEKYLFDLNDVEAIAEFVIEHEKRLPQIAQDQFAAIEREFSIVYQMQQMRALYLSI